MLTFQVTIGFSGATPNLLPKVYLFLFVKMCSDQKKNIYIHITPKHNIATKAKNNVRLNIFKSGSIMFQNPGIVKN